MWAEGCSGREKGLWGLGKWASWKWSPRTPGSKEGIKGIRGRSGKRTRGKATDPIAYLWPLINLKIPLPSSLAHTPPEIYYPFHHTDATQSTTDPSHAPRLFSLWNRLPCPFPLLQKLTFLTPNVLAAGKFSEAENPSAARAVT